MATLSQTQQWIITKQTLNSLASFWTCGLRLRPIRDMPRIFPAIEIGFHLISQQKREQLSPLAISHANHLYTAFLFLSRLCCSYRFKYARFTSFYRPHLRRYFAETCTEALPAHAQPIYGKRWELIRIAFFRLDARAKMTALHYKPDFDFPH